MTILEKKVDAIARHLLEGNPLAQRKALAELRQLMAGNVPFGSLEEEIDTALTQLCIPAANNGFRHLAAAIRLCVEREELSYNITKQLYPGVAEACETTAHRAERAIRHAIELCFERCDPEIIEEYFGNSVSPNKGKLTNSEFIVRLSNVMRQRMNGR